MNQVFNLIKLYIDKGTSANLLCTKNPYHVLQCTWYVYDRQKKSQIWNFSPSVRCRREGEKAIPL
jgi:surface antigen